MTRLISDVPVGIVALASGAGCWGNSCFRPSKLGGVNIPTASQKIGHERGLMDLESGEPERKRCRRRDSSISATGPDLRFPRGLAGVRDT
jgi:hypothetical protein